MTFITRKFSTRRRLVAIAALAGGLLLASPAVSASASVSVPMAHTAVKKAVVPKVVAKTAYDAKNALKKAGLRHKYLAPKGSFVILSKDWTVTKQSPKANAKVPAGTKVTLTVVKTSTLNASVDKPSAPAGPVLSVSQQQAFLAAKGYIATGMGFSHQGLIDQLSSTYGSGFSVPDATVAVDALGADWNAQAVISAKGYIATGMGFSHQSLLDQLSSAYGGKFTPEQAAYAVAQVGL